VVGECSQSSIVFYSEAREPKAGVFYQKVKKSAKQIFVQKSQAHEWEFFKRQ